MRPVRLGQCKSTAFNAQLRVANEAKLDKAREEVESAVDFQLRQMLLSRRIRRFRRDRQLASGRSENTGWYGWLVWRPSEDLSRVRAEEIVKFRRVVGSDWLEYIYNV